MASQWEDWLDAEGLKDGMDIKTPTLRNDCNMGDRSILAAQDQNMQEFMKEKGI